MENLDMGILGLQWVTWAGPRVINTHMGSSSGHHPLGLLNFLLMALPPILTIFNSLISLPLTLKSLLDLP